MTNSNISYPFCSPAAAKPIAWLVGMMWLVSGCQQESLEIAPLPVDKVITVNSPVAALLERISLNDGSADNILDLGSCTKIVLPVTVLVNGQSVEIKVEEDLKQVERIWDESPGDDDTVAIQFPVTLKRSDYSTVLVPDQNTLTLLVDSCEEGGGDDDIECLDLKYPVTFSTYDSNNQSSGVVIINNDEALYQFFVNLSTNRVVGIKFPLVMVLSDGSEVTVTGNNQLVTLIESFSDSCDEDDDNDFDDDDVDTSALSAILTSGSWKVDYLLDETDKTFLFSAYQFTFNSDSTATATNGMTTVPGLWTLFGDDGTIELDLDLGESPPFILIQEDWEVVTYSSTEIQLSNNPGKPDARRLIFKKV